MMITEKALVEELRENYNLLIGWVVAEMNML